MSGSLVSDSPEARELKLAIAHVLFMDVVGYSRLLLNQQQQLIEDLNRIVRKTTQFQMGEASGRLISIPVGDGIALVFFDSPEQPARCALEIAQNIRRNGDLRLRMGIHSGPVNQVKDVNERTNVAGAGINIAERVMSCGDAGHILVTRRVAEDLGQSTEWRSYLRDFGEMELKHGVKIGVVNLCSETFGNPRLPAKMMEARQETRRATRGWLRSLLQARAKRAPHSGRNLEQYDFYPFVVNRDNIPEFSLKDFRLGMHYFLKNEDATAARQLIFIGEQNNVRDRLEGPERDEYERFYEQYDGRRIADDTAEFLENYARIVHLIGKSFPNLGIEILLHNLADPAHSLTVLENDVTGRTLGAGATNLVIDLKRRQLFDEDKLNYELNIGARRFKCTTIPIIRRDYGVVGAICINVDSNYLTEEVVQSADRVKQWLETFCRTDVQLDENILSKDEYARALEGKRHFKDQQIQI